MQQHQGLKPVIFYVLELVFFIFKKSVQKCAVFKKKFVKNRYFLGYITARLPMIAKDSIVRDPPYWKT